MNLCGFRGFESHPHRQNLVALPAFPDPGRNVLGLNALFLAFSSIAPLQPAFYTESGARKKSIRMIGLLLDVFGIRVPTMDRYMESVSIAAGALSIALLIAALLLLRAWRRQLHANQLLSDKHHVLEQQITQAIFVVKADGSIRRVNPAAVKWFGFSEEELRGQNISQVLPEVLLVPSGDGEIVRKGGSRTRVRYKTAKAPDQETYIFFEEPLPQAGSAKREPPRQPATLEVAERVVSRIVRQLEGLLTTINGYTELALHETGEDSPIRKDLEEIATASDTASHLARHLLAFTGNQLIPLEIIDLNALLEKLQPQFSAVQVEFCAERLFVLANGQCLGHILVIFCGSARHRVGRETVMQIVTSRRQVNASEYAAISISDGGPVLAPSTLAFLFEPLFLDREGVGVELSAIYGMVRNMGGLINVTSEATAERPLRS